ncbi:DUF1573 domain-containing protein [Luteolibacter marinus]|uniref:DUF1573 domain-containing protein n=1 Tax=Luteolibacter marinus TaxID=2776705 RepID=UPI001865BAF0|nr:DUF1573 domain-containing protein [Luteolibacter marinus]
MKLIPTCWLASCLVLSAAGELTFDELTKVVEAGPDARVVTMDFNFKNETDGELVIDRYDAACTCIEAKIKGGKLIYQPGESGVIRASFDMSNFSGTVDKSLMVWMKGDRETMPSVTLTTRVKIPELVEMDPKTLIWEKGSKVEPKTVTLTMKHTEPIRITSISGADSRFSQELKTIEDGKKYEVVVTPASTDTVGMGVIHIETDCPLKRYKSQRIFMVVRQPLAKPAQASAKP